jgi:iron complex outermembrane receptor protein
MAYAKYSRGYKTGGFNSGILAPSPLTLPETVDAFEVGLKKTVGRVFQANLAGFYYDYKNDQQPVNASLNNVVTTIFYNVPVVHLYGVELEALWQPIPQVTFNLSYAYLHSRIERADCLEDTADPLALAPGANTTGCTQVDPAAVLQNIVGQQTPLAPHHKISLNGVYRINFEPGSLALSGTFIWKDSEYDSVFNRSYNQAPSYSQVNLNATWTGVNNRYNIILFCNNVFDTRGYDAAGGIPVTNPGPNQIIDNLISFTAPRTFGVEVQVRWR